MQCQIGQPFGANYNPTYALSKLVGHTGIDVGCGFGTPIYSKYDGLVYKVLTKDFANSADGFTGLFMIVDDGKESFEWLVGHCDPSVAVGMQVKKGDLVGTEANHGTVFSDNIQITLAMQRAGDQRGAHRHYQKRPIKFESILVSGNQYLDAIRRENNGSFTDYIYQAPQGYCKIWNYNNGFNGCVDPTKPVFIRDLWVGNSGYDVYVLQRILVGLGYLKVDPTGYYGTYTMAAVSLYQKAHNLTPMVGYFGPKTRALMLRELSPIVDLLAE